MKDYIVTDLLYGKKRFRAAAFYEKMKLAELRVEPIDEASLVGMVFRGTVENVAENIHGAFVRIGGKKTAFLPLAAGERVRGSSPLLVQVTKDASGVKAPVLTTNIHVSGEFAVLSSVPGRTAFSSKLSQDDRSLIKKWLRDSGETEYHLLVRTNALRAGKKALLDEVIRLKEEMDRIVKDYAGASAGDCLYAPEPFYLSALRDAYAAPDRCFSDIPECEMRLRDFLSVRASEEREKGDSIRFTEKAGRSLSLPELYNLPHDLEKLLQKRVWLPSGAFIVIEQTEAFVSVDVNTGKSVKGRIPEETYRKINLEAAEELARQIRLRNLSGILLVDFINLKNEDHKEELINVMKKLLRKDHIHSEVVDLTQLGIMEIIRQKVRKPLAEILGSC